MRRNQSTLARIENVLESKFKNRNLVEIVHKTENGKGVQGVRVKKDNPALVKFFEKLNINVFANAEDS